MDYKSALSAELSKIEASGRTPSLLLHSCCAPCSSYVLELLARYFKITVLYYNPNIYPRAEFDKRVIEQKRLLTLMRFENPVDLLIGRYDTDEYRCITEPYANEAEGGKRCARCIRLRLNETARAAQSGGYDYYTTTLTVSPHKNAAMINAIGEELSTDSTRYLVSDFKKNDGYKRSVQLSRELCLYRQSYCGCEYSAP